MYELNGQQKDIVDLWLEDHNHIGIKSIGGKHGLPQDLIGQIPKINKLSRLTATKTPTKKEIIAAIVKYIKGHLALHYRRPPVSRHSTISERLQEAFGGERL